MIRVDHIEFVLSTDFKLLKIYEDEHSSGFIERFSWWVANQWTPAKVTGEEGTEFHMVQGIEITDFMNINHIEQSQKVFVEKLVNYVEAHKTIICKFHPAIKWKL